MNKFKNKYRVASARAPWWDYGSNAAYFVTICTQNRNQYFGHVNNGKMNLSAIGHIANSCWHEIPNHFPFVELGAHIIMPNHVHGIVIINKPDGDENVETQNFASLQQQQSPKSPPVKSTTPSSLKSQQPPKTKNKFGPQSKNLASIIRGFKIGVTKNARLINTEFGWQSRYHDHIIRDDQAYHRISNYIIKNPANWREDKFYNQ